MMSIAYWCGIIFTYCASVYKVYTGVLGIWICRVLRKKDFMRVTRGAGMLRAR